MGQVYGMVGTDGTMTYVPSSLDRNRKPVTPHQQRMDRWHMKMAKRYLHVAARPWLEVTLDSPPPE